MSGRGANNVPIAASKSRMAAVSETSTAAKKDGEIEYTRLHITPFNAALVNAIVPPSMAKDAKSISFHQLQNFPEKEYGFVELPEEMAMKIKKKLNGAILRGNKIVIEEARAAPRIPSPDVEMAKKEKRRKVKGIEGEEELEDSAKKESKKRKRHDEAIKGQEVLDRQIKRGWTDPKAESKAEKKRKRSSDKEEKKSKMAERERPKYTTEPECLFRTHLPPNALPPANGIEGVIVNKKPSRKPGKNVVLHEFGKTEKFATFLRSKDGPAKTKPAVEFLEGKGWFDEDGNVVESELPKSKHNDEVLKEMAKKNKVEAPKMDDPESELDEDSEAEEDVKMTDAAAAYDSDTSSSGTSFDGEDDDDDEESEAEIEAEKEGANEVVKQKSPVAEGLMRVEANEPIQEDAYIHTTTEKEAEIVKPTQGATGHKGSDGESSDSGISSRFSTPEKGLKIDIPENPLEAIFKPRAKTAAAKPAAEPTFGFGFGGDDLEEEEDEMEHAMPVTPYTQQDCSYRGLRSAAPTPDTAHPSRKQMNGWPSHEDDDNVNGYQPPSPTQKPKGGKVKADIEADVKDTTNPMDDFQKWFYEHRGDTNRAWKKRRKEVKKEVRQRENRKGGNKNNA